MDVYLLPRYDGGFFLFSVESVDEPDLQPAEGEPFAKKLLDQARRAYRWVTRRRRLRERMLKSLGEIDRVRIVHPSTLAEDHARAVYEGLIQAEVQKHGKWLMVDAAAVPASIPLSLIPGPNLVLGYLAWRSVSHYRAKKAGRRAAELPIDFVPSTALAELENLVRNETRSRQKCGIRRLGEEIGVANLDKAY